MPEYDLIVVGGGPVGLASAYYAAAAGKRVLVLERDDFFNERGSSGGLSRMFRVIHSQQYLAELALQTEPLWADLEKKGGQPLLDRQGTLWFGQRKVSTTEGEIEAAIEVMKTLKLPVEELTPAQVESRFGFVNVPKEYIGVFQQNAATIRVKDVIRVLHNLATAGKVETRTRATVTDLVLEKTGVTVAVQEQDAFTGTVVDVRYRCDKVILCPGPYVNDILKPFGFELDVEIWQLASAYFRVRQGKKGPPMWFVFQSGTQDDPGLYYGFPEAAWERPGYARVAPAFASRILRSVKYRSKAPDVIDLALTSRYVATNLPNLDPNDAEQSSCLITMTQDQDPVLDFIPDFVPYHKRVVLYVGGWGFKFVPLFGKALAELALEGRTNHPVKPFRVARSGVLTTQSRYRSIVRKGLSTTVKGRSVAIAGAGVAGLVAGSLLEAAGAKVTIVEAGDRVGGRVRTLRKEFDQTRGPQYAEAGAMRIPSFHVLVNDYIEKFDLPTDPFLDTDPGLNGFVLTNGVRVRRKDYLRNPDKLGYPVAATEVGKTAEELLDAFLKPIVEFIEANPKDNWRIVLDRYDKYSIRGFLKEQTRYSEAAIEMIGVLLDEEALMSTSFIEGIRDQTDISANNTYREIRGGMDRLPRAFLPQLDKFIRLQTRVTRIEQDGRSVKLTFSDGGKVVADRAIITIPFSALRLVEVAPAFSYQKMKAIRQLHYDTATKILLQFRRRFWEQDDGILGGATVTDLPVRFVYYPSHDLRGEGGGVVLASYTWGDESLRWDALPEGARIEYALQDLAKIHGETVRKEFVKGVSYSWLQNEHTRGAFALFNPGQQTELLPAIASVEGRVHFAGEHTTLKHAWIEGAIESGIRAALEVATALRSDDGPGRGKATLLLPDWELQAASAVTRRAARPHELVRGARRLRL